MPYFPQSPWQPAFYFLSLRICVFQGPYIVNSCSICPSVFDLFYSVWCLQGSSHCSMYQSFLPFKGFIIFHSVCVPHLVDFWGASILSLVSIMLPQTLVYKYLFESLLSILLCTYEEVELLDHVVIQRVSQVAQWWRICLLMQEMPETLRSLGWEDPLEGEMVTHSSILARKISWTEEPSGL